MVSIMFNELTASQFILFIRTIDKLAKEDVRIAFQEWFDNPLKDSTELYLSSYHGHEYWNDEIEEYLKSLGFFIDTKYYDKYEGGVIITISVNPNDSSNSSELSLLEEVRKLSKDSITVVYQSQINDITEQIRTSASKALNHVQLESKISDKVEEYFKD